MGVDDADNVGVVAAAVATAAVLWYDLHHVFVLLCV